MNDMNERAASANLVAERQLELSVRLADLIGLARLMPGHRTSKSKLALHLRARAEDIEAILPAFVEKALLMLDGDDIVVAAVDRASLMHQMEKREPLEKAIAHAAAVKATASQRETIAGAVTLMKRSAMVGDMEGYMNADRVLEKLIGEVAALPESFEKLVAIKRDFRRAWCAHNRLRDLNVPAELRQNLAEAITKGDAQAAVDAVHYFLEYLRKAY
jgi:DNA-binding FadR family transcriptional regulator